MTLQSGERGFEFSTSTAGWFNETFAEPTPAQLGAWAAIAAGHHTLVVAPTGSGKTLAAFLSAIDRLATGTPTDPAHDSAIQEAAVPGTKVLYISPLKALAVDVERNLRSPLVGISRVATRLGEPLREVSVGVRSGDTPPAERRALSNRPPEILITTPESLFLMLTSAARESLRCVDTVIIDEIHAVAGTKRGAHLAVSLERLDMALAKPAQRIGLSATVRPHEEIARFLAGAQPVKIVAPASPSYLELSVEVPVEDMTVLSAPPVRQPAEGSTARGIDQVEQAPTIWPHIEESMIDRILSASSTIVFTNSRGVSERLTARLNEAFTGRMNGEHPSPTSRQPAQLMGGSGQSVGVEPLLARAHHGSVSKEQRALIEDDLKSGLLRCVVATSSLELGIDMGAVELVVQVATPPSVASGLQRVGRAGHHVGQKSTGLMYPISRHDLLATAVTAQRMAAGQIEEIRVGANPLDVLAQQTIAAAALEPLDVEQWFDQLRRCAPFATLPRSIFEATLDLISGRYPSDGFAELRPRVVWDRTAGVIIGRPGAQRLAVTSGGTIPDRGMFAVVLHSDSDAERGGKKVGELDEEMVYESRINDVIALGATSWRIMEITHDRVIVVPAFGEPARLPFWRGDSVGRPFELGQAIGAFVREYSSLDEPDRKRRGERIGLNDAAVNNLDALLKDQREATGYVPDDVTLVVERFRDELGDWRLVLLSSFGRGVHAPWALALSARIQERFGIDGSVVASDDGIVARLPDTETDPPGADLFVFDPAEIEPLVSGEVGGSALFAARFRECAARALLLPRRNRGARAPLWQQRQRASQLLDVARQYPDFPILLETAREVLNDVYDLPALTRVLKQLASREARLVEVATEQPSPFARTLLFGYTGAFLYDSDLPLAERRAAALALDPTLLAELLGRTELRELLDPDVIARTESEHQRLDPDRQARNLEGIADLLRLVGPLTTDEVSSRAAPAGSAPVADWLKQLVIDKRAIEVQIARSPHWASVEDASRLRDGLGCSLPLGIPAAHLESVQDPLGDLIARYARTHGPFTTAAVSSRFGLGNAVARDTLLRLSQGGRVAHGEFLPVPSGDDEWVDAGVLRRLRARSLAAARDQVEPVDATTFARFLPPWQHVGGSLRGVDGVLTVIEQLAGVPLPASAWESLILPARVRDYNPGMLDELISSGDVWWTGAGQLGRSDGWVLLVPHGLELTFSAEPPATDSAAHLLLTTMSGSGAFLFQQLKSQLGDAVSGTELGDALWQLVWSGSASSDTFAPVRHLSRSGSAHRNTRGAPRVRGYSARRPVRATTSPVLSGRWFVPDSVDPGFTADRITRSELALARYGVVTKGAVAAERAPGGFAAMYRVLRELERSGAALRGYFIESLGAAQFAAPGSVDRLRALTRDDESYRDLEAVTLAATDPANPFGATLSWPELTDDSAHRPARKAGSLVVIHDGHLVLYVERGGKTVLSFTEDFDRQRAAARSLVETVRRGRMGPMTIQTVNGVRVHSSVLAELLLDAGFEPHLKGLRMSG